MGIEDEIFNQLVRLDILNYIPTDGIVSHECTCCGATASYKLSDEASDAMDSDRPYLYICEQCYKDALEIPRWQAKKG